MTYSHEDTVKFENPKKAPTIWKSSKIPYHASSVLLLSVLPNDHNRDIAGRNWVKLTWSCYSRPNKDTEKPLISKVLHMSITVQQLDNWSAMGGMQNEKTIRKIPPPHPWHGVLKYRKIWQNLNLCLQNINKEKTIWNNFPPNPNMVSVETSML